MTRNAPRSFAIAVALAVIAVLVSAGSAAANGPCFDPGRASACPVSTNATLSGSLDSSSETDYYVFVAAQQTDLTVTVEDVEDPSCGTEPGLSCGYVQADVDDDQGNEIVHTSLSGPQDPEPVEAVIPPGVYYVVVFGEAGSSYNPSVIPYQLTVNGNPAVQAPQCHVPRVAHDKRKQAETQLANAHCGVGAIHHVHKPGIPPGEVVRVDPRPGQVLPYGSKVAIYISARAPHHQRHRHRHRDRRRG